MELASKIIRLAKQMLELKTTTGKAPFVLVLGSNIMPIRSIEDSVLKAGLGFGPEVSDQWQPIERDEEFEKAWKRLDGDEASLISCVRQAFEESAGSSTDNNAGYTHLAELIGAGYFSTILTADISNRLENAMIVAGLNRDRWKVFHPLRYKANEMRAYFEREDPPVKITKLYGTLDDSFAFAPSGLSDFTKRNPTVLKHFLEQRVILVGYNHLRDRWPLPPQGGALYFSGDTQPDPGWVVYDALRKRGGQESLLVDGDVTCASFFSALREHLLGDDDSVGMEGMQGLGIPISNLPEDTLEEALASERKRPVEDLVHFIDSHQEPPATVSFVAEPTVLSIEHLDGVGVRFCIDGGPRGMNYRSSHTVPFQRDRDVLNRSLQALGRDIATYYRLGDKKGHESWRERSRIQGEDLYSVLFNSNPELLRMMGGAIQATGDDENLYLRFIGPRNDLGMPYELLYDGRGPLAVRHPIFREVTGIGKEAQRFSDVLHQPRHGNGSPLRVLLIASDTSRKGEGIDVDREVTVLDELIHQKSAQLGIEAEVTRLPTDDADLHTTIELLTNCDHDVVHFAGHGEFDDDNVEESCLYFWERPQRGGSISRLSARQLAVQLGSRVNLFYLSCCVGATVGGSHLLKTKDYLGMMDALVQAGVSNVLGFRWYVTDAGAMQFASQFYRSLFETQSVAKATLYGRKAIYQEDAMNETWSSPILTSQMA